MRGIGLTSFTLSLLILEKNEWVSRLFLAANDISWMSSFRMNCIWKVKIKGRISSVLCRNYYTEWEFRWGHWCNKSTFVGLTQLLTTLFLFLFAVFQAHKASECKSWSAASPNTPTAKMAEDADMRNELEEMQRRADQLADEVRPVAKLGTWGWARCETHSQK